MAKCWARIRGRIGGPTRPKREPRWDAAGRYTDANASAAELFGVQREAIIGASAGAFTRHEAPTTFQPGSSPERRVAGLGVGKAAEAEVKNRPHRTARTRHVLFLLRRR
jgi:PAS domain-containing protein